ncbi:MAG: GNAT family N-acetyltransferase [Pseudomonadota bacterium]
MPPDVEICWLHDDNRNLIEKADIELFDNPIKPEELDRFLASPTHHMGMAVADGVLIGFISAVEHFHPDKAPELFLSELSVLPNHRRRGIAKALVEALLDFGARRGGVHVWVLTETDNEAAAATYSSVRDVIRQERPAMFGWDLEPSF